MSFDFADKTRRKNCNTCKERSCEWAGHERISDCKFHTLDEWRDMESAPKDGTRVLLKFGDMIISGSFRTANLGEPQYKERVWRADCCGRLAAPDKWCFIE